MSMIKGYIVESDLNSRTLADEVLDDMISTIEEIETKYNENTGEIEPIAHGFILKMLSEIDNCGIVGEEDINEEDSILKPLAIYLYNVLHYKDGGSYKWTITNEELDFTVQLVLEN